MKGFLIALACLALFMAQAEALEYPHAAHRSPAIIPTLKIQRETMEEFLEAAENSCGKKGAEFFKRFVVSELPDGSCFGQAYVFMIANPPSLRKMYHPHSLEDQKQMVWFQAKLAAMVYYYRKHLELTAKAILTVREGYPQSLWSEDYIKENRATLISKLRSNPQMRERCVELEEEYALYQKETAFLERLEQREEALLSRKRMILRADTKTRLDSQSPAQFKNSFQKTLEEIRRNPSISDLVVGFDFNHNGIPSGHAILVQLKHLRVYDAMRGIYQYSSFEEMKKDLTITHQKGCTYFHILHFGPN